MVERGSDKLFDVLSHCARRQLLVALLDCPDGVDIADAVNMATEPDGKLQLIHCHLPKLEELGYITWERDAEIVEQGPTWDEIEPVLRLLTEHDAVLPPDWV